MVDTLPTPKNSVTDTWTPATWEEFLATAEHPESEQARCYFDAGWMRIEKMPIGSAHGHDNSILAAVVSLYGTLKGIPFVAFTNTSFRKTGERECQPDLAYYIGPSVQRPTKDNKPVDTDTWGAPTLAIEISSTSLSDDLGQKRLLYERLGVLEYWVVNVESATTIAFTISNGGSWQIQESAALLGLPIAVIEEALQHSKAEDDGAVGRWLLQQFQ